MRDVETAHKAMTPAAELRPQFGFKRALSAAPDNPITADIHEDTVED